MTEFTFTNITPWAAFHGFKEGEVFEVTELFEGDADTDGLPTHAYHLPCVSLYRESDRRIYTICNCDEEGELSYS